MFHRDLYDKIVGHLSSAKHSIVIGARQTGKTTLLKQVRDYCKAQGYLTVYIDLEHLDILSDLDENPQNLMRYCPDSQLRKYVFIDEVQKLKNPSNFLKQLYDDHIEKEDLKVVATGSSAFWIDMKFDDSLAGRKRIFNLYTCSFQENLLLSGKDTLLEDLRRILSDGNAKSAALRQLQNELLRYMQFGGYPDVVTESDEGEKIMILRDLRDSFVKKNIDESGIGNTEAFYRLFQLLAVQSGGLVNISELSKLLRIKDETVSRYISVMERCFQICMVKPFHRNFGKEVVKMPMCYFLDLGMRNVLMNNFLPFPTNPAQGQIWENQVFRALVDRFGLEEIRFWRTTDKKEVDFVLPDLNPPAAVEVKKSSDAASLSKYKAFTTAYPEIQLLFACLEPFNEDLLRFLFVAETH